MDLFCRNGGESLGRRNPHTMDMDPASHNGVLLRPYKELRLYHCRLHHNRLGVLCHLVDHRGVLKNMQVAVSATLLEVAEAALETN